MVISLYYVTDRRQLENLAMDCDVSISFASKLPSRSVFIIVRTVENARHWSGSVGLSLPFERKFE